jgi:hypothetical protein
LTGGALLFAGRPQQAGTSQQRLADLEHGQAGFEARDPNMLYLGIPVFDSLRSDPRFQSLLRRMNLPQ